MAKAVFKKKKEKEICCFFAGSSFLSSRWNLRAAQILKLSREEFELGLFLLLNLSSGCQSFAYGLNEKCHACWLPSNVNERTRRSHVKHARRSLICTLKWEFELGDSSHRTVHTSSSSFKQTQRITLQRKNDTGRGVTSSQMTSRRWLFCSIFVVWRKKRNGLRLSLLYHLRRGNFGRVQNSRRPN